MLSNEALFYTCIIPFIAFFGSFAFVLYPLRDVLHPTGACLARAHTCMVPGWTTSHRLCLHCKDLQEVKLGESTDSSMPGSATAALACDACPWKCCCHCS